VPRAVRGEGAAVPVAELLQGLWAALQPEYLWLAFAGAAVGTAVGVIPGLGPPGAIAILLPLSFQFPLTPAIIFLAAIYYGVMFGGSITSILINVPGEPTCTVACFDGYPLTLQGRGGVALALNALGSMFGGFVGIFLLVAIGPPLARWALNIGPPELFALLLLAFLLVAVLAGERASKAILSALFGLLLSLVGTDPTIGLPRFTFGQPVLFDGLALAPVFMGIFGLSEIMRVAEGSTVTSARSMKVGSFPKLRELLPTVPAMVRGSGIGFVTGVIPGMGALAPTFLSYATEKKLSKTPELFGKGALNGVAGPEAANNSAAISAFIPMLTLGIPGSATVAILMGAFIFHGVTPGPFLFQNHPDIVWPIIGSMIVGNIALVILNLPMVGIWARVINIPKRYLLSGVMALMVVGAYSIGNTMVNVWVLLVFGVVGYGLQKADIPLAPLALTFILGTYAEESLRRTLEMSGGTYAILWERPIPRAGLILFAVLVASSVVLRVRALLVRRSTSRNGESGSSEQNVAERRD
jgi:putative tricarboxylic transport membrane protein